MNVSEICLRAILFHCGILILSVREGVEISTPITILDISRYSELTNVYLNEAEGYFKITFENNDCEEDFKTEVLIHHSHMTEIFKSVLKEYYYMAFSLTDS